MTLEQIVNLFKTEEYSFFKYRDIYGDEIKQWMHFDTHHDFFIQYMQYYRVFSSLSSTLEPATLGIIRISQPTKDYLIRHPHQEVFTDRDGNQRGIPSEIANQVKNNLELHLNELNNCNSFSEIIEIVESCRVRGFGELAIYDTSIRIGTFLGIVPDRVYLHAGTRIGMEALEQKNYVPIGSSRNKSVSTEDLPKEFKTMEADEIQHLLCAEKDLLKNQLENNPKIIPF